MIKFNVSELVSYLKGLADKDYILSKLNVEGEISNYKVHKSGAIYMDIIDEYSSISCYCPKSVAKEYKDSISDGDNVIIGGRVKINERNAVISLIVSEVKEAGVGRVYERFEFLKQKLSKEGLFDPAKKKTLPIYPNKIGIVTSNTGAAIRDILKIIKRRNPKINIYLYPANVQGSNAVNDLIDGLNYFEEFDIDLLIIGRGGGSYEDLDAFNSETLARKLFEYKHPTISAVGHEIDYVISDFVADVRAATPSEAAEIAVPSLNNYLDKIDNIKNKIWLKVQEKTLRETNKLEIMWKRLENLSPDSTIEKNKNRVFELLNNIEVQLSKKVLEHSERFQSLKFRLDPKNHIINRLIQEEVFLGESFYKLKDIIKSELNKCELELSKIENRMNKLDTVQNLKSGYSLLLDKDNKLIKSIAQVKLDQEYEVLLSDGSLIVKVIKRS